MGGLVVLLMTGTVGSASSLGVGSRSTLDDMMGQRVSAVQEVCSRNGRRPSQSGGVVCGKEAKSDTGLTFEYMLRIRRK